MIEDETEEEEENEEGAVSNDAALDKFRALANKILHIYND